MASSAWGFNTAGIASATSPGLVQAGGYNVLPAGTVLPYAGAAAPDGFVLCQGQEISKTTYAQLYAAIADAYATQINPTTGSAWAAPSASNFRIPDYRGSFLRSVGTPSVGDAVTLGGHQVHKTAKNGLTATSSAPTFTGTPSQATATMNSNTSHNHNFSYNPSGGNSAAPGQFTQGVNFYSSGSGTLTTIGMQNTNIDHSHNFTASGTVSTPTITVGVGDNETRPLNKGVNYIIKY